MGAPGHVRRGDAWVHPGLVEEEARWARPGPRESRSGRDDGEDDSLVRTPTWRTKCRISGSAKP